MRRSVLRGQCCVAGEVFDDLAAEEGAVEVVLSTDGADLRPAAFKAVCTAGMELLYFGLVEKTLDELLMSMDSERIIYAPEKEDSGDEGNL